MRTLNQSLVRSIRLSLELDKTLQEIARGEDRTISNIIQRFLKDSVNKYLEKRPEFYDELKSIDTAEKKRLIEQLRYETGA